MLKHCLIVAFAFFVTFFSSAQISDEYQGVYVGEVPAYSTLINDQEIKIGAQKITIQFKGDYIYYQSEDGSPLKGKYEVLIDKKKEAEIETVVSNGRSLKMNLSFRLDKKKKILFLISNTDQPETSLFFEELTDR